MNQIEYHFRSVTVRSRSKKTPKEIPFPGSISFQTLLKEAWKIAMKSSFKAEKTARVHRLFDASNHVNRADNADKFSGNSSVFKWKNRQISSSKGAKYYGH